MGVINKAGKLVQGLAQLAEGTTEAALRADPTKSSLAIDSRDQAPPLTDLRIPSSLREWLAPALEELQFTITTVDARVVFPPKRSFDVIQNVAGQRALLHIPSEILKNVDRFADLVTLMNVMVLRDQVVIILSEGLESPAVTYPGIVAAQWKQFFKLEWQFVSWNNLEEIKPMSTDQKVSLLPQILKLEDLVAKAQAAASPSIRDEDIPRLTEIFASLTRFTDQREQAWRTFLEQAGLKEFIGGLNLTGAPKDVAWHLIGQLKLYAPLPTHPNDKVLGLFLCTVLTIENVKPDDVTYIKEILKKYGLAPSRTDL